MPQDGVQISGDLAISLKSLETEFPRYARAALFAGAASLKNDIKQTFQSRLPAATRKNPKYNDTLLDAVRNTTTLGDEITVHVLGTRNPGSGTYRARFFENGTDERFQLSRKGKKLKKKKSIGRIEPLHFFSDSVSTGGTAAIQKMEQIMNRFFDKYGK